MARIRVNKVWLSSEEIKEGWPILIGTFLLNVKIGDPLLGWILSLLRGEETRNLELTFSKEEVSFALSTLNGDQSRDLMGVWPFGSCAGTLFRGKCWDF